MKKILALLLVGVGAFVLTSCGENNPYGLDKKMSLEETSTAYVNPNAKASTAKTVTIPEGVMTYEAVATDEGLNGLILTMSNGIKKLAKDDFTIVTSGTEISNEYENYFLITSVVDEEETYGLFDFKAGTFLIPLSSDEVNIYSAFSDEGAVATVGKKIYNLMDGSLITDGEVGSKAFSVENLSSLVAYSDGYIQPEESTGKYFFYYYDLDLNLVDQVSFNAIGDEVEYFICKNGNILLQVSNKVNFNTDFEVSDGDYAYNVYHYIYEAKTGNKQELDLPFAIVYLTYFDEAFIANQLSNGRDYSAIANYNIVSIIPFENKSMGSLKTALFNAEMTELLHVYENGMTQKINDNLYKDSSTYFDKDQKFIGTVSSYPMIDAPYTLVETSSGEYIADETGKIVMNGLDTITVSNMNYVFSTNDAGELFVYDVKANVKKTIASSYNSFYSTSCYSSYKADDGTEYYIANDGTNLFSVSNAGISVNVDSTSNRAYIMVTESSGSVTYMISK